MKLLAFLLVGLLATTSAVAGGDTQLLASAEARFPAFVKELGELVNLDSGTDDAQGLAKVEDLLARRLSELGAEVKIVTTPPSAGRNVIGTFHGKGSKNFMLMIHYDTVFAPGEATRRPFQVTGNKAFGPGVADAKGGALIILHALQVLKERRFDNYKKLTVLFNADEEKSSLGSRSVIVPLAAEQDYVFVFEPPEKEFVTVATNGIAYVHLDVTGVASHAGSAPEKGRNASMELAHQLLQLKDLGNPAKGTTVNWTVLQGSDKVNTIPAKAKATADMRMSDVSEIDRVQRDASAIVQNKMIPDTEVQVRVENRRPPFSRNPQSDQLATVAQGVYKELGKKLDALTMRYSTDSSFAYRPGGKPAVLDTMGIVGDKIHTPDEFADLDSVAPRIYLTVRMLEILSR